MAAVILRTEWIHRAVDPLRPRLPARAFRHISLAEPVDAACVESVFQQHKDRFGRKRKTGARAMKWAEWDGLCTIRDLRRQVVTA